MRLLRRQYVREVRQATASVSPVSSAEFATLLDNLNVKDSTPARAPHQKRKPTILTTHFGSNVPARIVSDCIVPARPVLATLGTVVQMQWRFPRDRGMLDQRRIAWGLPLSRLMSGCQR
jgi:hypothetical protein